MYTTNFENLTSIVSIYDWNSHFENYYKKVPSNLHIFDSHKFSVNKNSNNIYYKKYLNSEKLNIQICKE